MKKLGLAVYLDGKYVGSGELCFKQSILGPRTLKDEIEATIATVCFFRKDDLLKDRSFDDFTVKGVII